MGVIAIVGIIVQITASVNGYRCRSSFSSRLGRLASAPLRLFSNQQLTLCSTDWQLVAGKLINSISMGIACNVVPTCK